MPLILPGNDPRAVFTSGDAIDMDQAANVEWRFIHMRFLDAKPSAVLAIEPLFEVRVGGTGAGDLSIAYNSASISAGVRGSSASKSVTMISPLPADGTDMRFLWWHNYDTDEFGYYYNGATISEGTQDIGATTILPGGLRNIRLTGTIFETANLEIIECGLGVGGIPTSTEISNWMAGTAEVTSFANPPEYRIQPVGDGVTTGFTSGGLTFTQTAGATDPDTDAPYLTSGSATTLTVTQITDDNATGGKDWTIASTSTLAFLGRHGTTGRANVTVTGTYTGDDPSGIVFKIGGGAFAAATSEIIGGGSFSATFSVAGYGYSVSVASADDPDGSSVELTKVRVGDLWVGLGQSNMPGQIDDLDADDPLPTSYPYGQTLYRYDVNGSAMTEQTGPSGDMPWTWALVKAQYASSVPICWQNLGIGATTAESWQSTGSSYSTTDTRIAASGIKGHANKPRAIWNQGESGAGGGGDYATEFGAAMDDMQTGWGLGAFWAFPIYNAPDGTVNQALRTMSRKRSDLRVPGMTEAIKLAPNAAHTDNIHLESPRDAIEVATMIYVDILGAEGEASAIVPPATQSLYVGAVPVDRMYIGGDVL